jgi:hypothetical protein
LVFRGRTRLDSAVAGRALSELLGGVRRCRARRIAWMCATLPHCPARTWNRADLDWIDGAHCPWLEPAGAPAGKLPLPGGYSLYEGIVETDIWFGPLFTNLRLTRTHESIHLRADFPLLQVQPLPREAYAERTLNATDIVPDMGGLSEDDWNAYHATIAGPAAEPDRLFGAYSVAVRKRRQGVCPFNQAP